MIQSGGSVCPVSYIPSRLWVWPFFFVVPSAHTHVHGFCKVWTFWSILGTLQCMCNVIFLSSSHACLWDYIFKISFSSDYCSQRVSFFSYPFVSNFTWPCFSLLELLQSQFQKSGLLGVLWPFNWTKAKFWSHQHLCLLTFRALPATHSTLCSLCHFLPSFWLRSYSIPFPPQFVWKLHMLTVFLHSFYQACLMSIHIHRSRPMDSCVAGILHTCCCRHACYHWRHARHGCFRVQLSPRGPSHCFSPGPLPFARDHSVSVFSLIH